MAGRSLTPTDEGIQQAISARTGKGWNVEELAAKVVIQGKKTTTGIGVATVKKFFSGKSVDRKYFVGICVALDLKWEEIVELTDQEIIPKSFKSQIEASSGKEGDSIEALIQTIRQKIHADIRHRCGTMRVLDMEQPIGVDDIYTSVNILEKLPGRRRLGLNDLWEGCDLENFDRLLLGKVKQERIPGLDAVERHDKLMILGKPGAGKTTFMKRLATLCNQGKLLTDHVPVFVTLKEFAEAENKPSVQEYVAQQWRGCEVEATDATAAILKAGKAMVLLDGLDEVLETEHNRVLQEIKNATRQFRDCQFVITCRIAAREYTFEQFTEVEVADFDKEQIAEFATKWFKTKQDPKKGEMFIQQLKNNKPIQELATNPLLLTLLCLVFGDGADFPPNRAELYKEGLDILLKKWDAKRNIARDQVYKKLSLRRKENLLSQLAFKTFDAGEYFFKQDRVERHIIDYIRNLPGANDEEEALQLDSEAVLKSIEAQHGLLVERARGIYSFSHLTFQEYFTAKQITNSTSQRANLAIHIQENRYRETFFLAVGMLPVADELLMEMKQMVDRLIVDDQLINDCLLWADRKAKSVDSVYKLVAIRAFYLCLAFGEEFDYFDDFILAKKLDKYLLDDYFFDCDMDKDRGIWSRLSSGLSLDLNLTIILDSLGLNYEDYDMQCALEDKDLPLMLDRASFIAEDKPDLLSAIQSLRRYIFNGENIGEIWDTRRYLWQKKLRSLMIQHRNIGYARQLTEKQIGDLYQYYQATLLLVECLNSDCYVTKETRQEIEDTLLLPVSKL